jgi:hypothetical protein
MMKRTRTKNWLLLAGLLTGSMVMVPSIAQAADKSDNQQQDAGEVKTNTRIPLVNEKVVFEGQTYTVNGDLHVTFSSKKQKDGFFIKVHINAQGVSVTAPDGTAYRGVGAGNLQVRTNDDGATFKTVANVGLIGQGKAPNFRLHVNLKGSVDGNGKITVEKENVHLRTNA